MAEVGRVASQVMELTGQLVEKFNDQALAVVNDNAKSYWAAQMQAVSELNDEEVCDVLCFWCDFVDNTSFKNDVQAVSQLTQKFIELSTNEELLENDIVKHTVAYGIGAFAHALPKEAFQPFVAQSVALLKGITRRDEAFSPENMDATENAMGALAKIAYKHIDGSTVTEADLSGVFSFFPFKSDECEA